MKGQTITRLKSLKNAQWSSFMACLWDCTDIAQLCMAENGHKNLVLQVFNYHSTRNLHAPNTVANQSKNIILEPSLFALKALVLSTLYKYFNQGECKGVKKSDSVIFSIFGELAAKQELPPLSFTYNLRWPNGIPSSTGVT